jgi:hypothetical protein
MAANASTSMSRWKCAHYETNAFDVDRGRDADGICCCRKCAHRRVVFDETKYERVVDEV